MKLRPFILSVAFLLVTVVAFGQNKDDKRVMKDAEKAIETMAMEDSGVKTLMKNSAGYVVFPNVGSGALIVGAATGNGVLYENGSAVGMAKMTKLDVGLQAGGESFMQIIFFETQADLNEFKEGEFEFSGEVSALMIDEGAAKKANYTDGVIIVAKPKAGVMADISVGGQKFSYSEF